MRRTELEAAFIATTYRVSTPGQHFDLRIGVVNPAFDDFLRRWRAAAGQPAGAFAMPPDTAIGWGIVTAFNPGQLLALEDNQRRQRRLAGRLAGIGYALLAVNNLADDDAWPVEPSFLLLPADVPAVAALGREFGQLAVVHGASGEPPVLLWL